jgi:hypothetical protein
MFHPRIPLNFNEIYGELEPPYAGPWQAGKQKKYFLPKLLNEKTNSCFSTLPIGKHWNGMKAQTAAWTRGRAA